MSYHAPPSTGSKLRDSAFVADRLREWSTTTAALPFAGLGRELERYEGAARLVVADSDPAVRAYWQAVNEGGTTRAADHALALWAHLLHVCNGEPDEVQKAWKLLSRSEPPSDAPLLERARWAIATFAGARNGGRRRNKKGQYNWPYAPKSYGVRDLNWLPSRIPSAEKLHETDAWGAGRIEAVLDSWEEAFAHIEDRCEQVETIWERVAFLTDPPYGEERGQLYDGSWTDAARDCLIERTRSVIARGAHAIVWCGVHDIAAWERGCSGLTWSFRAAATHMKSASGENKGAKASGGYIGVSR